MFSTRKEKIRKRGLTIHDLRNLGFVIQRDTKAYGDIPPIGGVGKHRITMILDPITDDWRIVEMVTRETSTILSSELYKGPIEDATELERLITKNKWIGEGRRR
jgi:hypothetical protein